MVAEIIDMDQETRALVTVRTIDALNPIPEADAIETATVDGWKVVVKKGDFKVGDGCIYCEIDSFLPDGNPAWQFLVDKSPRMYEGVKGHKLRTIKLKKQLSQGLVLPLNACPQIEFVLNISGFAVKALGINWAEGQLEEAMYLREFHDHPAGLSARDLDFSKLLGVKKYDPPLPACLSGQARGNFPSFLRKSDQQRCQNIGREIFGYDEEMHQLDVSGMSGDDIGAAMDAGRFRYLNGAYFTVSPARANRATRYEVSLKLDGSSMTAYRYDRGGDVREGVCSRNLDLALTEANQDNSFVRVYFDTTLNVALARMNRNVAVQGELMGPGIQGNRENLTHNQFFVYNIFDIDRQEFLTPVERMEFMRELRTHTGPQIQHVPVLRVATLFELGITDMESLLKFADGPSLTHAVREGLVFKAMDGTLQFKAISDQYLLKEKD